MEIWGKTDCGKVRKENQDVFMTLYDEDKNVAVLVVCDGMGGARAGNVASLLAAESFMHYMSECLKNTDVIDQMADNLSDAVVLANNIVYETSLRDDDCAGMGTTLTAAVLTTKGVIIANVGDSRAYHIKSSGIKQITKDHSVVEDMITRGDLTRAEARGHPNKHLITRALGTSGEEKPDLFFIDLEQGDHLLLCTDGLSSVVMDSDILLQTQKASGVRECCEKLIEIALLHGAPDNVTAVILKKP